MPAPPVTGTCRALQRCGNWRQTAELSGAVVGEKVLKLEERFGYAHKGIERRFTERPLLEAHRLAARVSGDSAGGQMRRSG